MTKEKQVDDLHKKRLVTCVPLAKEAIKILAKHEFVIGDDATDKEGKPTKDSIEGAGKAAQEILELMLKENINFTDRNLIMALVLQAFEQVKQVIDISTENNYKLAEDKLWKEKTGHDHIDLTFADINEVLAGE